MIVCRIQRPKYLINKLKNLASHRSQSRQSHVRHEAVRFLDQTRLAQKFALGSDAILDVSTSMNPAPFLTVNLHFLVLVKHNDLNLIIYVTTQASELEWYLIQQVQVCLPTIRVQVQNWNQVIARKFGFAHRVLGAEVVILGEVSGKDARLSPAWRNLVAQAHGAARAFIRGFLKFGVRTKFVSTSLCVPEPVKFSVVVRDTEAIGRRAHRPRSGCYDVII